MWDFSINRSLGLMLRTAPFIVFRLIVYFGIAVAYVLVTGVGAGIGWSVGAFGGPDFHVTTTFWGGALGFVLTAGSSISCANTSSMSSRRDTSPCWSS
jgi:hypothetical protein